jgi:GlpG protein
MYVSPTLRALLRSPVTGGVAIAAAITSAAWWMGADISWLLPGYGWQNPWGLVTSGLVHVDLMHLAFNLYWLWAFGTVLESRFGHLKTAGLILAFAAVSEAAESTFLDGGVGLSGVGYGLMAMLWVMGRRDVRFAGIVDRRTLGLFAGWFVLCIVLTVLKIMAIGNIAHAAGAVAGGMAGLTLVSRGRRRAILLAASGAAAALLCLLTTVARPWVSFSPGNVAYAAYEALMANKNETAVRLYRRVLAMEKPSAVTLYNYAIALQRTGQEAASQNAYDRAYQKDPQLFFQQWVEMAREAKAAGRNEEAVRCFLEATRIDGTNPLVWSELGRAYRDLGREDEARTAEQKAEQLQEAAGDDVDQKCGD